MRGVNCWTDSENKAEHCGSTTQWWGGRSSIPFAVYKFAVSTRRKEYRELLEQQLQDNPHIDDATSKQNWDTLKCCIVSAAEEAVGRWRRKYPEWFEDSSYILMPLVDAKNQAHQKALQSNKKRIERNSGDISDL